MTMIARQMLVMKRQTKGAVLYQRPADATANGGPVTSIYLRKSGFPTGKYPGIIHVSIETEEDIGS